MSETTRSEWLWRGLHFLCALMIPLILLNVMGCLKAKEEKADLGPEASMDQLEVALMNAVSGRSLASTSVGDFASYSIVRRLESEEATINMGSSRVEVVAEVPGTGWAAGTTTFKLRVDDYTRNNSNGYDHKAMQGDLVLKTGPILPAFLGSSEHYTAATAQARAAKPTKATFHNLSTSKETVEAPKAVQAKPGCGGLSPCELQVNIVQFDLVTWFDDDSYQKIAFDLAFNNKTPFLPYGDAYVDQPLGHLITKCLATLVPVDGRTVYVRDCLSLEDFQK